MTSQTKTPIALDSNISQLSISRDFDKISYDNNFQLHKTKTHTFNKFYISKDYNIIDIDSRVEISKNLDNAYISLLRKVIKTGLSLSESQQDVSSRLLKKMAHFEMGEKVKILSTEDLEIQIFRELINGYTSLIIDEYGGVTHLLMGKKGFGYKCEYFEYEKIDERNLYILSNSFATVSL